MQVDNIKSNQGVILRPLVRSIGGINRSTHIVAKIKIACYINPCLACSLWLHASVAFDNEYIFCGKSCFTKLIKK